ncbi:MAG: CRISPR pre-crRNA endoribonuclease Cas5d [Phycisphaerae bacterium]|nr:CRISPR pre-crRNA endoribonuclease Cas5d [Phycisphaerae bacterium]
MSTTHVIEVWGDFACYSRPELKVERWSFQIPPHSGARGLLDAIYCHPPEFRWQVTRVELLAMPTYIALRRNEVGDVASVTNIGKWIKGAQAVALMADDSGTRQQRQTMAIRNPRYRIHARIVPWPGFERQQTAFDEQFRRRASQGKCFQQPYLGCREFVAFFRLVEDVEREQREKPPVPLDQDVGFMVYDVFDLSRPGGSNDQPSISLFHAVIRSGVLNFPAYESKEVRKPARRAG